MKRVLHRELKTIPSINNLKESLVVLQLNHTSDDEFFIKKCSTPPPPLYEDQHFEEQQEMEDVTTTMKNKAFERVQKAACNKEYPSLADFEEMNPPNGRSQEVILYTTSLSGIRKTFQDCNTIKFLLRSLRVIYHERDVSLHLEYREELWKILGGKVLPPKLFIKGRYIGGVDEVIGLHESGWLGKLLEGTPIESGEGHCNGCACMRTFYLSSSHESSQFDLMDLPSELFHLILQKVSLVDTLMNCRATCRSWRKAADAILSSKLPLMLSLSPPERPHSRFVIKFKSDEPNLASLSAPWINDDESSTVLTESWPQSIDPSDIIRVQSVQGWLMFNKFHHVIDQDKTYSELSFFNPFSRARFKLPWLFLFSGRSPRFSQVRVVFNSAPPGSDEFVVVFLFVFCYEEYEDLIRLEKMKQRLAFIRFKQGSWIEIESIVTNNDEIFYDIAVDDDDKLYALTFKHETSVVFVLTLGDDHHDLVVERLVLLNTVNDRYVTGIRHLTHGYYKPTHQLAMDTGTEELLLVLHENETIVNRFYRSTRTEGFRVYKLEMV
ncbi:hypothetical protein PIB30_028747 [Stylosanthes scabra]|uniref:F-box domain-containing protein n=1 Tax=Stylosanthes scabra TaxID=79078 RepID=A0ABU6W9H2_9FABA|nr:hypothetical protein [Stylosanthes scabra]